MNHKLVIVFTHIQDGDFFPLSAWNGLGFKYKGGRGGGPAAVAPALPPLLPVRVPLLSLSLSIFPPLALCYICLSPILALAVSPSLPHLLPPQLHLQSTWLLWSQHSHTTAVVVVAAMAPGPGLGLGPELTLPQLLQHGWVGARVTMCSVPRARTALEDKW